ncbi:hypothetical protein GCM10018775_48370 [Streptomyces umbrinus]|nr:hypothetical protein GCM10018775_48370 [Streptomyces umbrinus]
MSELARTPLCRGDCETWPLRCTDLYSSGEECLVTDPTVSGRGNPCGRTRHSADRQSIGRSTHMHEDIPKPR